jgi:hypothetical protein
VGDLLASPSAPDAITPILGYRLWEVRGEALCSLWFSAIPWAPQQKLRAACYEAQGPFPSAVLKRDRPLHAAPDPRCRCGLYAASDPEDLPRRWSGTREVIVCGVVALWGRVLVGERGWRGEFARPLALSYEEHSGLCGKLAVGDPDWRRFFIAAAAERYRVPVLPRILDAYAVAAEVVRNPGGSRAA